MIAWAAETLAAVTLLMLLVLAVRRPVARLFGAGWAYALWAVPALRLILPPLPQIVPDVPLPPLVILLPSPSEAAAPLSAAGPEQWALLVLLLWAGGALAFLAVQFLSYRAFLARVAASERPADPPAFGGIETVESEAVEGPMAVGILRRRIVVPADFPLRYSRDERRLALEHELVHHRRGDIRANIAALVVLALNWFNPIAWIAHRAFRADQELACDAAVTARTSAPERHDYACALVKSASRPGLVAVCPLNRADQLKHRLRMMAGHRASRPRSLGGAAALSLLGTAALTSATIGFSDRPSAAREIVYAAAPAPAPARPAVASAPVAAPAGVRTAPRAPTPRAATPAKAADPVAVPVPPEPPREIITVQISAKKLGEAGHAVARTRVIVLRAGLTERHAEIEAAIAAAMAELDRSDFAVDVARAREALARELARMRATPPVPAEPPHIS